MNKLMTTIAAGMMCWAEAVFPADVLVCGESQDAIAMRARMANLELQVQRLEHETDRAERRGIAEFNMKRLREASGQLRHRDLSSECRVELMGTMFNALVRNEQAARADSPE